MAESSENTETSTINPSPQNLWKVVITLFTAFTSILAAGFTAGIKYQESQSNVIIAESKGSLAQYHAKLEVAHNRVEQLNTQLEQWRSAYQKLQSELTQQQRTIASLTTQLGRSNNCTFIHEQIVTTQRLIEHPNGIWLFSSSKEVNDKEQERIASLQRRLESYQQQLSTCNR
ncbi:hypothetical protein [Stenotrophomonas acidaminiphila]|uniref:hypothetical protein n=1 Tax=Stenotrophomonas acidaminiphila TaxID=128780 RepID=UPI0028A95337|nr:hypothetical protein [Stenotrophomonas acidaminiphila]